MPTDTQETLSTETNVRPETENTIRPTDTPGAGGMDESNPAWTFRPIDVETLLEEPEEEVPWILDGYLARGLLTLLAGPPKLGKTTLAYDAIVAVATGQPFLNRDVAQAKVLLLGLEEHRRDIVARLRDNGGDKLAGQVKVIFGPLPFTPALLKELAQFINQEQIGLVVVDTIHAWWGLSDENDAAEVMRKGFPLLLAIRRTRAAWLGLAHTRKGGGEGGEEIRGSSALLGLVDVAVTMKRTESGDPQRCLTSFSRYADTPRKLIIEFGPDGYRHLGSPEELSAEGKGEKLWAALTDTEQTVEALRNTTGLTKQEVSRAVTRLGEKVIRDGEGHKGDPYRYRRNSIRPSTHSESETPDESNSSNEAVVQEQELAHV